MNSSFLNDMCELVEGPFLYLCVQGQHTYIFMG